MPPGKGEARREEPGEGVPPGYQAKDSGKIRRGITGVERGGNSISQKGLEDQTYLVQDQAYLVLVQVSCVGGLMSPRDI